MTSSRADATSVAACPLWRRLVAALLDAGVAGGLAVLVLSAVVASDPSPPDIPAWALLDVVVDYIHLETARTVVGLTGAAVAVLLVLGLQLSSFGLTLGLRVMRLAPVDVTTRQPSGRTRLLAWVILGLGLGFLGGATWWWGFVDTRRRTLHDRLTGLAVVSRG